MYVSMAGRVARALIAETPGVFRPAWTIDQVAADIDAIRDEDGLWTLVPTSGYFDHMTKSFAMARGEPA
jgi:hypothetical protein